MQLYVRSVRRRALGRRPLRSWFCSPLLGALLALSLGSCRRADLPTELPGQPSVRLYIVSTLAGAMEPCGCRKDMLGGIDHAAALLASEAPSAPRRLLLAVGPLFFQEPTLSPERREQDLWKAEALAASLADLKLAAWAPGENDLAAGTEALGRLTRQSGARLLGASPAAAELPSTSTAMFDVGPYKVGVAGLGAGHTASSAADAARALKAAAQTLKAAGAQIRVALIAAKRGDGLRLAETVPDFDVVALGKPTESGDANDATFAPTLVGRTLVVQAPNHLQALAYVDLFVVPGDFTFEDGMGIELMERRESLKARLADLEARRARWGKDEKPPADSTAAVDKEIERAKGEQAELERRAAASPKVAGSTFRYEEALVRETRGSDASVAKRMSEYYRRVNDHNKTALAQRMPPPLPYGTPGYVGGQPCIFCHRSASDFWQRTPHADAYTTLSREFKEYNLDCVSCHVTGYERPGGSNVTHVDKLQGVQCEACHGPGSLHATTGGSAPITRTPAESVCRSCHHTPHVADDWNLLSSWSKIVGEGHGEGSQGPASSERRKE
jgi:2',3'-cyclic-nucleotide 2'-phosphodiesterase (5'-nucleotidase family)